jgi:hypothetical protein
MDQITEPAIIAPPEGPDGANPYTPPVKKGHVPAGAEKLIFVGIALLGALLGSVFVFSHKAAVKAHSQSTRRPQAQQQTTAVAGVTPADQNATPAANTSDDEDDFSPKDVLATKNEVVALQRHESQAAAEKAAQVAAAGTKGTTTGAQAPVGLTGAMMQSSKQLNGQPKAIGLIEPFQPPVYNGAATPPGQSPIGTGGTQYQTGASYSEAMHTWNDEVTKPRLLFSRKTVAAAPDATQYLGPAVTNFGMQAGFHIAARLEASASTSVKVPVTAVIEYNYEHDGQLILPAGSRALGHIESADAHGNMAISFESVDLPNGSTVPISAVAVDTNLRSLKGQVTGRNRGTAMLVATMAGIGQTTAMMLGNNSSAALSGDDVMRERLAQNMGNTADSQVNRLMSDERIIVTLAAGTEFYLVFTKPALPRASSQSSPATNMGQLQTVSVIPGR